MLLNFESFIDQVFKLGEMRCCQGVQHAELGKIRRGNTGIPIDELFILSAQHLLKYQSYTYPV